MHTGPGPLGSPVIVCGGAILHFHLDRRWAYLSLSLARDYQPFTAWATAKQKA